MKKKPSTVKTDDEEPTSAMVDAGEKPAKKKPFANTRPRSEWKTPIRRVKGRVKFDVCVGADAKGDPTYAMFTAELSSKGLRVHREHRRRKDDKVWPLEGLVNGVNRTGQMEMFAPKPVTVSVKLSNKET